MRIVTALEFESVSSSAEALRDNACRRAWPSPMRKALVAFTRAFATSISAFQHSRNVIVNGIELSKTKLNHRTFIRQHIGFIFQDHKILFDRTVYNNVRLPLDILGYPEFLADVPGFPQM